MDDTLFSAILNGKYNDIFSSSQLWKKGEYEEAIKLIVSTKNLEIVKKFVEKYFENNETYYAILQKHCKSTEWIEGINKFITKNDENIEYNFKLIKEILIGNEPHFTRILYDLKNRETEYILELDIRYFSEIFKHINIPTKELIYKDIYNYITDDYSEEKYIKYSEYLDILDENVDYDTSANFDANDYCPIYRCLDRRNTKDTTKVFLRLFKKFKNINAISINPPQYWKNKNLNILHMACMFKRDNLIEHILERNIDLTHKDSNNNTALILALSNAINGIIINKMLEKGDNDIHCINKNGHNALYCAKFYNYPSALIDKLTSPPSINNVCDKCKNKNP